MTKLEQARRFLSMGIATIPLRHRGKEPEAQMMGGAWEPYKTQLPTEYDLNRWLGSGWQNYGVIAGWDNLAMIDFDTAEAFEIWQAYFKILRGVYETPFIVRSARGAHVYIRLYGKDLNNQKRRGVDLKVHGYCVGPESIHPSGAVYTPITDMVFPDVFDLETILPSELFPPVVVVQVTMPVVPMPAVMLPTTEYDPWGAASSESHSATGSPQGLDLVAKVKTYVRIENLFPDAFYSSGDHRWMTVKCPFHADHRPSAWIDTRRQLFGCQTCGFLPMDAINLYAKMHGINESTAVVEMAREVGALV